MTETDDTEYVPGQMAPGPVYVDIDEARAICGVSRRTIYNWIKRGKLGVARTPGGSVRIRRGDLLVSDRV